MILGILCITLCGILVYSEASTLIATIKSGNEDNSLIVTKYDLIGFIIEIIPLAFLAYFVRKDYPNSKIVNNVILYIFSNGIAIIIVYANLSSINLKQFGLEALTSSSFVELVCLVIVAYLMGALSIVKIAKDLKRVSAYEPNIEPYRKIMKFSGYLMLTVIGIPLASVLVNISYGFLGIFFLTSDIGSKKFIKAEIINNNDYIENEVKRLKEKL